MTGGVGNVERMNPLNPILSSPTTEAAVPAERGETVESSVILGGETRPATRAKLTSTLSPPTLRRCEGDRSTRTILRFETRLATRAKIPHPNPLPADHRSGGARGARGSEAATRKQFAYSEPIIDAR